MKSCKTFIKLEMTSFSFNNILRNPPDTLGFVFLGTPSQIVWKGGNLIFVLVPNTIKAFYQIILKCKMHKQSSKQVPDDRNSLTEGMPLTNELHSKVPCCLFLLFVPLNPGFIPVDSSMTDLVGPFWSIW